MATMQDKIFCVYEFIKTEMATAVQLAFRLRFNIQPPTRKSICRWNHQFELRGCVHLFESLYIYIYSFIHSSSSLSYDRSKASSKANSPHRAIQSFLFRMIYIYIYKKLCCPPADRILSKSDARHKKG